MGAGCSSIKKLLMTLVGPEENLGEGEIGLKKMGREGLGLIIFGQRGSGGGEGF